MIDEDAYYDRMFADSHWNRDAPECEECGGEIDDDGDCLECGQHHLNDAERKEEMLIERAERRQQEISDERISP